MHCNLSPEYVRVCIQYTWYKFHHKHKSDFYFYTLYAQVVHVPWMIFIYFLYLFIYLVHVSSCWVHACYQIEYILKGYAFSCIYKYISLHQNWSILWALQYIQCNVCFLGTEPMTLVLQVLWSSSWATGN